MFESVIPRLLGWVPASLRRALIGHPGNPSRLANIAHNFLNRIPLAESQVFDCHGVLKGYRMCVDWSRYRSFVYGTWEPKVVRAVTEIVRPGMTVIDIGAHVGFYSLFFAKCVGTGGRVFAFEPLPGNFALLQKNLRLNQLGNVHVRNQAVFSRTQQITITTSDDQPNPGNGSIHNEAGHERYRVEAVSMDEFCEEQSLRPDILKMDVEGTEYDVLLGAKETINRCRPNLLIELHHFDGNLAANPVPKLLAAWRYQIQWIERWELTSFILARPASN